jgi:ATP-dependent Clp protease adaptor protein ClpS
MAGGGFFPKGHWSEIMSTWDEDNDSQTSIVVESSQSLKRPSLYKVLLHNDDYTPMEFVVDILESVFGKSSQEAESIMLNVHTKGFGICGVYPFEIAETKVAQVLEAAKQNKHPLKCTLERE